MARSKKSKTRRSRKSFSVLNALESLTYAQIISVGTTGSGVWEFITGEGDLSFGSSGGNIVNNQLIPNAPEWSGAGQISLQDMMMSPGQAVSVMATNFQSNLVPMAAQAFGVSVGFKIGRRLLRGPINNINRNLVVPALGRGIRL
jgi:hypothetical protein